MPRVPRNRKQGKRKATEDPEERMTKAWESGSPLSDIDSQDVQPNSGRNDSSAMSSGEQVGVDSDMSHPHIVEGGNEEVAAAMEAAANILTVRDANVQKEQECQSDSPVEKLQVDANTAESGRSFTLTTGPSDNEVATGTEACTRATESENASDKMDVNKGECADSEQPVDNRDSSGRTESGDKDNEVDEEAVHSADDIRKELKVTMESGGLLRDVEFCTNLGGCHAALEVPLAQIQYQVKDRNALRRIYSVSSMKGGLVIHNFGLSDPADFLRARGYIRRKNPPGVGHFFLPGSTTLSALLGGDTRSNRQVCIRPMWELFRRGMAFVGKILDLPALYVPTYKDGVIDKGADEQTSNMKSGLSGFTHYRSRYSNSFTAVTDAGVDIPIYDARKTGFSLSTYSSKLGRHYEELKNNSIVIVTFTIGAFKLKPDRVPDNGPKDLDTSLSFNVKDVILMADADREFVHSGLPMEDPWGVELIAPPSLDDITEEDDKENIPPLEAVDREI